MELEPTPSYRGIILTVYNHTANNYYVQQGVKLYTDSEGTVFQYHYAQAHGPFATRGRAKAAITREEDRRDKMGGFYNSRIAEQYTFIEETSSVWTVSK